MQCLLGLWLWMCMAIVFKKHEKCMHYVCIEEDVLLNTWWVTTCFCLGFMFLKERQGTFSIHLPHGKEAKSLPSQEQDDTHQLTECIKWRKRSGFRIKGRKRNWCPALPAFRPGSMFREEDGWFSIMSIHILSLLACLMYHVNIINGSKYEQIDYLQLNVGNDTKWEGS